MIETSRRRFFGIMGAGSIAAKATVDSSIAELAGVTRTTGLGDSSMNLFTGAGVSDAIKGTAEPVLSYGQKAMAAAQYVKQFGLPKALEEHMRDESKYVTCLDPDIACKASWSMSVKIMTQRERNFQKRLKMIEAQSKIQGARMVLEKVLKFEWPW